MAPPARRSRRRAILVGAVVVFLVAGASLARFYTDVLWFQEVGFESVLWTSLGAQALTGAAVAVAVAVVVWVNLLIAGRSAPAYGTPFTFRGRQIVDPMERYRDALAPYLRWLRVGVAVGIGVLAGIGASAAWRTVLLWLNRVPFGERDPQFGKDVSFYVFDLPFFRTALDIVWFALIAAVLVTLVAHSFHGSFRPQLGLRGVTPGALAHVSVLLGLMALVKAVQYYLGTYALNFSQRGIVTGASYTDVNAHLHALRLLAIISVVSAVLFIVNIRVRRLSLPLAAVAIWVLTSFLAGFLWPLAIQSFVVGPQELQREREFIARNIAATREAFGLSGIETQTYPALEEIAPEDLAGSENVLNNVRLWDPGTMGEAYEQLQAIRTYYRFPDVDIDRYEIDGETRQVLVSARELSIDDLPPQSQGWQNQHLQYTHGYGLVASFANTIGPGGEPDFIVGGVPGRAEPGAEALEAEQPRIYFGEGFEDSEYSIVNSGQAEVDYPTDEGLVRFEYDGDGGIELSNVFRKIAFATREGDPNLVLSGLVKSDSRVLIYRNIRDRIRRAAPFLSLDSDPYVATVDGRLVWILDAYTTTPWYPYSERYDASQAVAEPGTGVLDGNVNYVRNSVKVVVDAYEGDMKLYVVDEEDPLIQAWRGAFPSLFTDEEPSDDLRAHFRYPEDLFNLQTEVYRTYHMTEPDVFFTGEGAWELPDTPATYLLTQLPGETEEEFLLSRTATPRRKKNMVSILVARSDPESYGELSSYVMPSQSQVNGPAQAFSLINQDVEVSEARTLLGVRGSIVSFGSLVILPIEGSILYVQPIFVTAESVGIPELKKVALVLGDDVAFENTFDEALASLFDLEEPDPAEPDEPSEPGEPSEPDEPSEPASPELAGLVERAGRVYDAAQAALAEGDFEEYGRLIERLGRLLDRAGLLDDAVGNQPR